MAWRPLTLVEVGSVCVLEVVTWGEWKSRYVNDCEAERAYFVRATLEMVVGSEGCMLRESAGVPKQTWILVCCEFVVMRWSWFVVMGGEAYEARDGNELGRRSTLLAMNQWC